MTNKEAIEILTNVKNTPQITWTNGADVAFDLAIKALKERPQGEWILLESCDELCRYKCSNCGHQILSLPSYLHTYKGCFCGADMRGGRE